MTRRFEFLHLAHHHEAVGELKQLCNNRSEIHHWVYANDTSGCNNFKPDIIVVHLMVSPFPDLLKNWPNVPVVWAAWGQDYYYRFRELSNSLLLPKTVLMALCIGKPSAFFPRLPMLAESIRSLKWPSLDWLTRIEFVSTFAGEAFPAKQRLATGTRFIPHLYGSIDLQKTAKHKMRKDALGIIIGPSANLTSNLPDALHWIKSKTENTPIRVILSYGPKRIVKYVDRCGHKLFGSQWHPLKNLLDQDEFLQRLSQSHCLLVFSTRMQGVRTILYALTIGMRVVLHPKNPALEVLKMHGVVVFSTYEITEDDLQSPLTAKAQQKNRDLMLKLTNESRVHDSLNFLMRDIQSRKL